MTDLSQAEHQARDRIAVSDLLRRAHEIARECEAIRATLKFGEAK